MREAREAKGPHTARHSTRVGAYAQHLAERFGLSAQQSETIHVAGLLHDVGKIDIPDAILTKPGRLSAKEFDHMKRHSALGTELLRPIGLPQPVLSLIRHHHEWHDGNGYPDGLSGDAIPFGAKIIQTADCVDAMMSPRSYKRGLSVVEAISELQACSGTQFDPDVAKVAMQWLANATPPQSVEDRRLEMPAISGR